MHLLVWTTSVFVLEALEYGIAVLSAKRTAIR